MEFTTLPNMNQLKLPMAQKCTLTFRLSLFPITLALSDESLIIFYLFDYQMVFYGLERIVIIG